MMNRLADFVSRKGIRAAVLVAAVALLLCSTVGGTLAYVVAKTPTITNTFTSGITPYGSLTISKTLEHPFGDDYVLPNNDNVVFSFNVDLGTDNANKTFGQGTSTLTANDNGVVSVQVKAGYSATIDGIPAGTKATVTETTERTGFSVEGDASQTATIAAAETAQVAFTNVYAPAAANYAATVTGTKELSGRDWQEGDSFTYLLEYFDGKKWVEVAKQDTKCELDSQGKPVSDSIAFDFTNDVAEIIKGTAGTHQFRVTEVDGTIPGMALDETVSLFTIVVGDADMDGSLELQSTSTTSSNTKVDENHNVFILFKGTYAPEGSTEVIVPVEKKLTDMSGQGRDAAGFTFGAYDKDGKLVEQAAPTDANGDTSLRFTFDADDVGKTFAYTVKEIDADEAGMTYDDASYTVRIAVTDNLDGAVSAQVVDEADKPVKDTTLAFANTYDPADASMTIAGTKRLDGRNLKAGEFSFSLYETGVGFALPEGAKPLATAKNDGSGAFAFGKLTYSTVGTHRYVVTEDASEPLEGVTYDEARYLITVTVTDEGGSLKATQDIRLANGSAAKAIAFENAYAASPAPGPEEPEQPEQPIAPTPDDGQGDGDAGNEPADQPADTSSMAKTGDNLGPVVIAVVAMAIVAAAVAVIAALHTRRR